MVVETVHALMRFVHLLLPKWIHVQARLLKNLADLCGIEVLQLVEIDRLKQVLLLVGQR